MENLKISQNVEQCELDLSVQRTEVESILKEYSRGVEDAIIACMKLLASHLEKIGVEDHFRDYINSLSNEVLEQAQEIQLIFSYALGNSDRMFQVSSKSKSDEREVFYVRLSEEFNPSLCLQTPKNLNILFTIEEILSAHKEKLSLLDQKNQRMTDKKISLEKELALVKKSGADTLKVKEITHAIAKICNDIKILEEKREKEKASLSEKLKSTREGKIEAINGNKIKAHRDYYRSRLLNYSSEISYTTKISIKTKSKNQKTSNLTKGSALALSTVIALALIKNTVIAEKPAIKLVTENKVVSKYFDKNDIDRLSKAKSNHELEGLFKSILLHMDLTKMRKELSKVVGKFADVETTFSPNYESISLELSNKLEREVKSRFGETTTLKMDLGEGQTSSTAKYSRNGLELTRADLCAAKGGYSLIVSMHLPFNQTISSTFDLYSKKEYGRALSMGLCE
jgi:hypothetical protein